MAHQIKFYGRFWLSALNKEVNLTSDTIKAMLCSSAYTPDQDTHRYKSDVTGEIAGTGYVAGGKALTGVTVTYDPATNRITLDAADLSWDASTLAAKTVVLYDSTPGSDATRPLIGYAIFDTEISSTAAPFQLIWDAAGVGTVTVS